MTDVFLHRLSNERNRGGGDDIDIDWINCEKIRALHLVYDEKIIVFNYCLYLF